MLFAYSGRRSTSLSAQDQTAVAERLRKLLIQVRPSAVVGAAACGADLILLELALELSAGGKGPEIHVVLPTPPGRFRDDSVAPDWHERFDDVLHAVRQRGSLEHGDGSAEDVYNEGNLAILGRAKALATNGGERAVALAIGSPGEGMYTTRFVRQAKLDGIRELRIDPAARGADRRRCFVVMPYGEKWDAQRGFTMNCDLTYGRFLVPALEHAQLHYRRADETIDPGAVLPPMIDDIARADLVIADLATGNFNVGWELGLRHLLRDRSTVLIKPAGKVPAPFDVQALRSISYDHDATGFSDDAALEAWERLEPYLEPEVGEQTTDSPVGVFMDVTLAKIEPLADTRRPVQALREALSEARDAADAQAVEDVVSRADALEDPADQRLLHAEAGTILRRLGRHDRARDLLAPIVAADPGVHLPAVHQQLVMALYQRKGATAEDYERAEEILDTVDEHGGYPENDSLRGAVAKRRARLLDGDARRDELERARGAYRAEYVRNLNDHYAGVNVLAVDAVLALAHEDADARAELTTLLPAVRLAARLRLLQVPGDYWARATLGEVELLARLGGESGDARALTAAYEHAVAAGPLPEDLDSTRRQIGWYETMGIEHEALAIAAAALGA